MSGKSIFDKLWERHVITGEEGEPQAWYRVEEDLSQGTSDGHRQVERSQET